MILFDITSYYYNHDILHGNALQSLYQTIVHSLQCAPNDFALPAAPFFHQSCHDVGEIPASRGSARQPSVLDKRLPEGNGVSKLLWQPNADSI